MEGHAEEGAGVSNSVQSVDGGGQWSTTQPYSQRTIDEFRNQVSFFAAELDSATAAIEARSRKLRQEEEKADRVRKELERKEEQTERKLKALQLLMRKEMADRWKREESAAKLNKEIERKSVEVEGQAAEIRKKQSELEACMRELDARKKEIGEKERAEEAAESMRLLVMKWKKEMETKEKEIRWKSEKIEEQAAEIRCRQREFEVRMSELDAREKEMDEKGKRCTRPWIEEQFEVLSKRIEDVVGEQFRVIGERIEDDFDSREKQIDMKDGESVLEAKRLWDPLDHSSEENISASGEQLKERLDREEELECKKLAKRVDEFDSKEKQVEVKSEESVLKVKKLWESFDCSSEATIRVCVTMNGRELQAHLNEHCDDHNSVKDEVERALKLSPDPAKLVLDAMEGFFPLHLKKGGVEFEAGVVRKSCIMLLEWLTKMSPYIRPSVREEAKELAFYWNEMVNKGSDADADYSLNVLAFLQLLAAFELASCFDDDQLATQLGIIAHCSQAPMLLRDLGFADKMSSIIQEKLIQKNHKAEAAGLISVFELHCEFPTVILPEGNHRREFNLAPFLGHNDAAPPTTPTLRSFFNTVSITPDLGSLSGQLSVWSAACADVNNTNRPDRVPVISSNSLSHQREMSMLPARQPGRLTSEPASCSSPFPKQARNEFVPSPWNLLFVGQCLETGSMHLEALCDKIASDKLFCIEISDALLLAPNPTEFVLGVAKNPSSLTLKRRHKEVRLAFPEHGLLLLLNRMWRMSPHVKPHVQREALSFAKNWRSKIAEQMEGHFQAVCFLLFVAAYKLVIYFDRNELFSVIHRENRSLVATKLFTILGFKDYIPTATNLSTSHPAPSNPTMSSSSTLAAPDEIAHKRSIVAVSPNEAREMTGSNATFCPPQQRFKKKRKIAVCPLSRPWLLQ